MNTITKPLLFILGVAVLLVTGILLMVEKEIITTDDTVIEVSDFASCVEQTGTVMESYPRQCNYDGVTYREDLTEEEQAQYLASQHNQQAAPPVLGNMTVVVGPQLTECGNINGEPCLVVDGTVFHGEIEGFSFMPGYEYELEVKRYLAFGTDDPAQIPQGGSMFGYKLVNEVSKKEVAQGCVISGCSGELCVSTAQVNSEGGVASTCQFKDQYFCYRQATCELQQTGECGWTQDETLTTCLRSFE